MRVALVKAKRKETAYQRHLRTEENRIAGMFNFVIFLSIAAVGYTDWIVVPNISLGYLYVLPIALSGVGQPAASHAWRSRGLLGPAGHLRTGGRHP